MFVRRGLWVAVVLAVLFSPPARADLWYESYENAERAIAAQDWEKAIEQIRLALEKKGDSSVQARTYGMNFTDYFPYYKLGIAYFNLGQLELALQALESEERLGAIQQSREDMAALAALREKIDGALENNEAAERERIDEIVNENLVQAGKLEQRGDYEGALAAVDEALSVAPDDGRAGGLRQKLLAAIALRQADEDLSARVAQLVAQGRREKDQGQLALAASTFKRAQNLKETDEARTLLGQVEEAMRAQATARSEAEKQRAVVGALQHARSLAAAGNLVGALGALQDVLALDPSSGEARKLQETWLARQSASELDRRRRDRVGQLLEEADRYFKTSAYRESLVSANLALATDPGNPTGMEYVRRAHSELGRRLLRDGERQTLPPQISFAEDRNFAMGEVMVERVRRSDYRLNGNIASSDAVTTVMEWAYLGRFDARDTVAETEGRASMVERAFDAAFSHAETGGATELEGHVDSMKVGDLVLTKFGSKPTLSPGLTVFRVTATDTESSSSSMKYAVLYDRPITQSPWLYAGFGGAVVAFLAGLGIRRRRKRNRLLRRHFNPYIAGAPVLQDHVFFGRERLLNRVLQSIHNNSILVYGERRIGKTSFQHRLKKRLTEMKDPDFRFFPVYIDLQGTPQEKFFSTLAEDIFQELEPHLDGCKPDPSLHDGVNYQYRELVRDIRQVLKALERISDKKVKLVMLIDEVDELNDYDPRINQRLRSLFMKSFADSLAAVVSGVSIKKHWESEGSPWYNFFEEIEVKPFRPEDAKLLIESPIKGIFQLDPGVVDRIIQVTDCKPYLIQKLCIALVNRLHENKRRRITLADVEAIGRPKEA